MTTLPPPLEKMMNELSDKNFMTVGFTPEAFITGFQAASEIFLSREAKMKDFLIEITEYADKISLHQNKRMGDWMISTEHDEENCNKCNMGKRARQVLSDLEFKE